MAGDLGVTLPFLVGLGEERGGPVPVPVLRSLKGVNVMVKVVMLQMVLNTHYQDPGMMPWQEFDSFLISRQHCCPWSCSCAHLISFMEYLNKEL